MLSSIQRFFRRLTGQVKEESDGDHRMGPEPVKAACYVDADGNVEVYGCSFANLWEAKKIVMQWQQGEREIQSAMMFSEYLHECQIAHYLVFAGASLPVNLYTPSAKIQDPVPARWPDKSPWIVQLMERANIRAQYDSVIPANSQLTEEEQTELDLTRIEYPDPKSSPLDMKSEPEWKLLDPQEQQVWQLLYQEQYTQD